MVVEVKTGDGQAVLILLAGMQRDPVVRHRHVFAEDMYSGDMIVGINPVRIFPAPASRAQECGIEGEAEADGAVIVTADEAPRFIIACFVAHAAVGDDTPIHVYRPFEHAVQIAVHMAHIVSPDLARAVGHAVGE